VWGVDPDTLPAPGLSAYEMLDRLGTDGGVRVLLLGASNPVVSAPNTVRVTERLSALDFLCVTDFFLTESARLADVVLPTTQFAEEEGTLTNLEGRLLRRRRALDPPAGVRTELEIWHALAERLGHGAHFPTDPRAVFDELRRAGAGGVADYAGIDWDRLDAGEELFWPCPDPAHPGSPRLFAESFPTPDGRARFVAVTHHGVTERVDRRFPYLLTTGRSRTHYQSGAQTRRSPTLAGAEPRA
jgi:assimilatory nitrate reductase catalytic subunit